MMTPKEIIRNPLDIVSGSSKNAKKLKSNKPKVKKKCFYPKCAKNQPAASMRADGPAVCTPGMTAAVRTGTSKQLEK